MVRSLVDFIRYQRFEAFPVEIGGIREPIEPLYPHFDIRQATLQSVRSRLEAWETYVRRMREALLTKPFPLATLELRNGLRIAQMQGKANCRPAPEALKAVAKWAQTFFLQGK